MNETSAHCHALCKKQGSIILKWWMLDSSKCYWIKRHLQLSGNHHSVKQDRIILFVLSGIEKEALIYI